MAIMSSGTSLVVCAATEAVCLLRHGRRRAMVHTLPLAVVYGSWYAPPNRTRTRPPANRSARCCDSRSRGRIAPIRAVTQHDVLAVALVVIVAAGWVVISRAKPNGLDETHWLRRGAVPLALLAVCPAYYLVIVSGRSAFGLDFARGSRYLYVGTAFVLPRSASASTRLPAARPGWRLTAGDPARRRTGKHPSAGSPRVRPRLLRA